MAKQPSPQQGESFWEGKRKGLQDIMTAADDIRIRQLYGIIAQGLLIWATVTPAQSDIQ
jgi:hypothetical protein